MILKDFEKIIPKNEIITYREDLLFPEGLSPVDGDVKLHDLNLKYDINIIQNKQGITVEILNIRGILQYTVSSALGEDSDNSVDLSTLKANFIDKEYSSANYYIREVEIDFKRKVVTYEI